MTHLYRTVDIDVPGGAVRVGLWEPDGEPAGTALLVHGVTASHLAWAWLADELPDIRLVAPDLRGRGRSAHLPGPYGMAAHADDLAGVLTSLGEERVTVVGHSMGAFVALVLADRHPALVSRLVLVDGGLPLALPEGIPMRDAVHRMLGRTADRLSMSFPSTAAYLDFWRAHPAFAGEWSPRVERYFAYDLAGGEPALRAATSLDVVEQDSLDMHGGPAMAHAREHLRHPAVLLAAERGLADELPPLYPVAARPRHPGIEVVDLVGTNHYTIAMSPRGARAIAAEVSRADAS